MFANHYHDEGILDGFTNFNVVDTCFKGLFKIDFDDFQSAILVLPFRRRSSPNILILYLVFISVLVSK